MSAHRRWVHEGARPEPRLTERTDRAFEDLRAQYEREAGLQRNGDVDWGKLMAWGFVGWLLYKALQSENKPRPKRRRRK